MGQQCPISMKPDSRWPCQDAIPDQLFEDVFRTYSEEELVGSKAKYSTGIQKPLLIEQRRYVAALSGVVCQGYKAQVVATSRRASFTKGKLLAAQDELVGDIENTGRYSVAIVRSTGRKLDSLFIAKPILP